MDERSENVCNKMSDQFRFKNWKYPEIEDGKPTKYNWVVQHKDNLCLGYKTDIGAFTYKCQTQGDDRRLCANRLTLLHLFRFDHRQQNRNRNVKEELQNW